LSGGLLQAERGGYLSDGAVLEEAQHDGIAFVFAEARHRFLQQGAQSLPRMVLFGLLGELHVSFLFTALPSKCGPLEIGRRQLRRLIKPAGKNRSGAEAARLPRQNDEHSLRYFLGFVRIVQPTQRDGIHQIDMPPDKRRKGLLGMTANKLPQQFHVVGFHTPDYVRIPKKSGQEFSKRGKAVRRINTPTEIFASRAGAPGTGEATRICA